LRLGRTDIVLMSLRALDGRSFRGFSNHMRDSLADF
jgi:hypothetical protein